MCPYKVLYKKQIIIVIQTNAAAVICVYFPRQCEEDTIIDQIQISTAITMRDKNSPVIPIDLNCRIDKNEWQNKNSVGIS